VRTARVWRRVLGVEQSTIIERIEFDEDADVVIAHVRPTAKARDRCGRCGELGPRYDNGDGRRRWRAADLGSIKTFLEADASRVSCPEHGVTVIGVPWARHSSRFTRHFEDTTTWLAAQASGSAVAQLMRVTWRTVLTILMRVVAETAGGSDRLDGLRRIAIDEVAYRKGHRYLTVVVDHDTGRMVWAAKGRDKATLEAFFDALGPVRSKKIRLVSADAADWIATVVADRASNATLCMDPFHVVAWATRALDQVRRALVSELHRQGRPEDAKALKGTRWALLKNPQRLTGAQRTTLAEIKTANDPLFTGYLLKEQLRAVFAERGERGRLLLAGWLSWCASSGLPAFQKVATSVRDHLEAIHASLEHGLSNARAEANNTTLRMITRRAYGFHSPEPLIALGMLKRGGLCPPLPGR